MRCRAPAVIGCIGSWHRTMEFSTLINSEWTGGGRGRSGNVRGPYIEICGSVQMSVRRWAESVPYAIEDHRAEGCVQDRSLAGCPDFRPG